MKKTKRLISTVIIFTMVISIFFTGGASAQGKEELEKKIEEAVRAMRDLGVYTDNISEDRIITKADFSQISVIASGLESKVKYYEGISIYSDVGVTHPQAGYICVAVEEGFVSPELNGLFLPDKAITYAQVCTVLIKKLGYTLNDLSGMWPLNYIKKAEELGIPSGIHLKANDPVKAGVLAVIIQNWLNTNMKNSSQTYALYSGRYKELIVLDTSFSNNKMRENEILTDKGIWYISEGLNMPSIGHKYFVIAEGQTIVALAQIPMIYEEISVKNSNSDYISTWQSGAFSLPQNIYYYYKGDKKSYSQIQNIVERNTSMVFAKRLSEVSYEYGVIIDPVYSDPQIISAGSRVGNMLGSINTWNKPIVKNGELISKESVEINDVVYEVSDIWGKNRYILVVRDCVKGNIDAILPVQIDPKMIQIEGENYELASTFPFDKLENKGIFNIGDDVNLLLGYDGKAVDIIMNGAEDNSNFAVVINTYSKISTDIENFGEILYYVKLLNTDGNVKTYRTLDDKSIYRARLVTYEIENNADEDVVSLEEVKDIDKAPHETNKDKKMLDGYYISDNLVIFNLVQDVSGRDAEVYVMDWSSFPSGKIFQSKIKYIHHTGDFEDINLIFTNDILDEGFALGIVKDITSSNNKMTRKITKTYTIMVNGLSYTVSGELNNDINKGDVVKVRMSGNQVLSIDSKVSAEKTASTIQAVDNRRIKIGGKIYLFDSDVTIYRKDSIGEYETVGIDQLKKGEQYNSIEIYLNRSSEYGGKVKVIVFW